MQRHGACGVHLGAVQRDLARCPLEAGCQRHHDLGAVILPSVRAGFTRAVAWLVACTAAVCGAESRLERGAVVG